ncbi:hypothetical protein ACSLBF_06355 [Pseudoalteromonas sp. T1lg65]|uniref:hypothetical protein n=1 Tax=Pseudoalteromonas sp. T1lg65 TaxID=2077101 RepID=UPI003F7AB9A3
MIDDSYLVTNIPRGEEQPISLSNVLIDRWIEQLEVDDIEAARDLKWTDMMSTFCVDLGRKSPIFQQTSIVRYDVFLILTSLLYVHKLFRPNDLIFGFNIPPELFTDPDSRASQILNSELLNSLNIEQKVVLLSDDSNHVCFNQRAIGELNHQSGEKLTKLESVPTLFSEQQLIAQRGFLKLLYRCTT